jgi:uncharacterized protein YfcZ (UPF0381/DUF406 family)
LAKWDLSKLPEGRKPLPDEWFRERAQMHERIAELEAKLEKATADLQEIDREIMETVNDLDIIKVSFFFNQMCNIRTIIAELKEEKPTS